MTGTVDPVVEGVTDAVDPLVDTVTDTIDPVIGTVTDTIDPVVDTVITPTKGIIGTEGADPLEPLPWLRRRARAFAILDRSAVSPTARATTDDVVQPARGARGDLPWSGSSTPIARAPGSPV